MIKNNKGRKNWDNFWYSFGENEYPVVTVGHLISQKVLILEYNPLYHQKRLNEYYFNHQKHFCECHFARYSIVPRSGGRATAGDCARGN